MKTWRAIFCLALFGLSLAARGQTAASPRFFLNGTDWKDISSLSTDGDFIKAMKLFTLEGVCDGLTALLAQDGPADFPKNTQAIAGIVPQMTNEQIMDALDKFYVAPKNVDVPLVLALPIIARQAAGATKAQIQTMTETAEKIAAELDAAKTVDDFAKISQEIIASNKTGLPKAK